MEALPPAVRRDLRARAHALRPVVSIGHHGLTAAVLHEMDVAMLAHELIKVRVFSDDRAARESLLADVCAALDCAAVQQIGKILVLWRPKPRETEGPAKPAAAPGRRPATKSSGKPPARPARRSRGAATPPSRKPAGYVEPAPRRPGPAPAGVPRAVAPRRRRGAS